MQVIRREEQKDDWNWIQRATGEPRLGATQKVQRIENGEVIDFVIASEMNREVHIVTEQWFDLAKSAPIQSSSLRDSLGFCLATNFSLQLLQGKLNIPMDVDKTTALLIWEIQHLWELLHDSHRPTNITPDIYNYYWRGAKESTSSALLAVHFGHWRALIQSPHLVEFVCKQLNPIARCGIPPSRWSNGLQVLLEKVPGVSLVDKLRAILLMERDFNFFNKWIFGHETVNRLYDIDYIPQDQFSQKESTAQRLDARQQAHYGSLETALHTNGISLGRCR
jgi:hypothetical protein